MCVHVCNNISRRPKSDFTEAVREDKCKYMGEEDINENTWSEQNHVNVEQTYEYLFN